MPNLCLKYYFSKIHEARLNTPSDNRANHPPQMIDGRRGLETRFSTPSSSQSHHIIPNTIPESSLDYHSRDGLINAIAVLSTVVAQCSRRRLTLVRDKANLNVPTRLYFITYNDHFHWILTVDHYSNVSIWYWQRPQQPATSPPAASPSLTSSPATRSPPTTT